MFLIDDLLLGLAGKYLVPLIGDTVSGWFSDDADRVVAKTVTTSVASAAITTAARLTGVTITDEPSAQQAAAALQADPAKLADYQRALNEQAIAAIAEETKRLLIVNETARAEVASGDPYVRRMRPTFGYVVAAVLLLQSLICLYVAIVHPADLAATVAAMSSMSSILLPALAVLGIYVNGRTQEKGAPGIGLPGVGKKRCGG